MIEGEQYNMEKIARISTKKIKIIETIKSFLKELETDFINEEKLEKKEIITAEQLEKLGYSPTSHPAHIKLLFKNQMQKVLMRDMKDLSAEFKLIKRLETEIQELVRLTRIEETYFQATMNQRQF